MYFIMKLKTTKISTVIIVMLAIGVVTYLYKTQQDLSNKLDTVTANNETTKAELSSATDTIVDMDETIETLSSDYTDLELSYNDLSDSHSELLTDYDALKETIYGPNEESPLDKYNGTNYYNGMKETYYNLSMTRVVSIAQNKGLKGIYWVREDGVKMFGPYVIIAANLHKYPYGSVVDISLGKGIVLDTGGFALSNPNQFDVATAW